MSYALVRPARLDLDAFAAAAGMHPEMVRRMVALGILDAARDSGGHLWFAPGQVAVVARIQRLRAGFGLNYAAVGLVLDLLDRISALERARRPAPAVRRVIRLWTRAG
jgi:chaperone modulatory protein CbpM